METVTALARYGSSGDAIAQAVTALPLPLDGAGQRWSLHTSTIAWLRSFTSPHTRKAYFRDLADWLTWCEATGLDPRNARRGDIDTYRAARCEGFAKTTTARRLSSISSWYDYLVSNDLAGRNPVGAVKRPKVDRDASSTIGLSAQHVTLFMKAARAAKGRTVKRDAALLGFMAELGLRVGEALALDMASLRHNRGHRTVVVAGKGGKVREIPIPAPLGRDLDVWLDERPTPTNAGASGGPLFVTARGNRLDQGAAFKLVRRVATAAVLPAADKLSPHSLRHTVATTALDAGAPLRDVQDLLGHADPRTTRRYDRSRGSLDRSPAYLIANLFAHDD